MAGVFYIPIFSASSVMLRVICLIVIVTFWLPCSRDWCILLVLPTWPTMWLRRLEAKRGLGSSVKKVIDWKSLKRIQAFKNANPECPLPPEPVLTRWCSWLVAVQYLAEHHEKILSCGKFFREWRSLHCRGKRAFVVQYCHPRSVFDQQKLWLPCRSAGKNRSGPKARKCTYCSWICENQPWRSNCSWKIPEGNAGFQILKDF